MCERGSRLTCSVFVCKVRKSLEQIRIFTEHKDVLAQEIQDENDQLKEQLQRLVFLQGRKYFYMCITYMEKYSNYKNSSDKVTYLLLLWNKWKSQNLCVVYSNRLTVQILKLIWWRLNKCLSGLLICKSETLPATYTLFCLNFFFFLDITAFSILLFQHSLLQ